VIGTRTKAFSSQAESLGDSENATKQNNWAGPGKELEQSQSNQPVYRDGCG
jgi:hypothetical protein